MSKSHNWKKPREKDKSSFSKKKDSYESSGFSTIREVTGNPKKREHHSSIPIIPEKRLSEPVPSCSICHEPIQSIAESFLNKDGSYSHFDCVYSLIAERENIKSDEVLSYIGSGKFGVFRKGESASLVLDRSIEYESKEDGKKMRDYVESLKI